MATTESILLESNGRTLTLAPTAYQGLPSTLCKGCGHNSITSYLIEACRAVGVNPYRTVKFSGIGCSSKTPAYFLQSSHGFNALHGRMPSVATGASVANRTLLSIGVSGDGDTANIGLGQFKHACRRNLPIVYIVEDNGCYGLTKGQFSATADRHAHLRRETGEENPTPPFDLCLEAIAGGATFVARSFAGDKKQLVPLLKAALKHRGMAFLDIISPCVTFNDFPSSTKGWDWAREHELPLHEVGFVPRLPEIEVEQKEGEADARPPPRRLLPDPPRPAARLARRHRPRRGLPAPHRRRRVAGVPDRPDLPRRGSRELRRDPRPRGHPPRPPPRRRAPARAGGPVDDPGDDLIVPAPDHNVR